MSFLRIKGARKSFGGVHALNGAELEVPEKGIFGLIGPNGSGKSTLVNVLTGVFPADEGAMFMGDVDLAGRSANWIASHGLVRTFQVPRVFKNMSVIENMLVSKRHTFAEGFLNTFLRWGKIKEELEQDVFRAIELLEFLEIDHLMNELASSLSGGQQKLLALGRVLMAEPKVMLLDEPIAGVNPKLARKIFEKIEELRNGGMTFLIIEHDVDVLMDYCDEISVMDRGQIVFKGKPEEVLDSRKVIEVYMGE